MLYSRYGAVWCVRAAVALYAVGMLLIAAALGFAQVFAGRGLHSSTFSAQPEPYLTRNTPFKPPSPPNTPRHLLNTRKMTPKQTLNAPPIP